LDLGTGSLGNLRLHMEYDHIGAVVITHMHADHFIDLIPLRYALRYGEHRRSDKMPLYLPPNGERMLRQMVSAFADEGAGDFLAAVFDIHTYDPTKILHLGDAQLRFAHTAHYIPAFAVRYEREGTSLTYSADTAPDARVSEIARDTDMFICEATLRADDLELGMRGHCSAHEAATMAREAGARQLLLTHYHETATQADLQEPASAIFSGTVHVAEDGNRISLG